MVRPGKALVVVLRAQPIGDAIAHSLEAAAQVVVVQAVGGPGAGERDGHTDLGGYAPRATRGIVEIPVGDVALALCALGFGAPALALVGAAARAQRYGDGDHAARRLKRCCIQFPP